MTVKEKIRAEIVKLKFQYDKEYDRAIRYEHPDVVCQSVLAKYCLCKYLLEFIDSLQEETEPQFKVGDIICNKVWESAVHKIVYMDDSAYYFENGGMARFTDQEQWELAEESVSEDLEEAAKNHAVERYRVTRDRELAEKCKWSFKAGALWQKQQDSKLPKVWDRETLDEYAYQVAYDLSNDWMRETPTWDDVETAVKLGARWQKEKDQKK